MELAHHFNGEVQEIEDVNFSESALIYRVRDASFRSNRLRQKPIYILEMELTFLPDYADTCSRPPYTAF
ncbi:hypothetical protein GH714_031559 [Hevea brasiliensis]|uniref:Uncharacterized protein n=1 Tax=Hevea brasiliensis TaxID=3981 RepID=A0A6A6NB68_HEVBR|nr:hypothetical protein GH714_031559 [Hevea brasiliensis]